MYIFQQTFWAYFHRQNFYFIYKAPGGASNDLFVETAATCLSPPLFSLLSFSAIEFCDFCCCSTPRSSTFSSVALLPPREGWEVCLASWLGNRFSCGQKYDYGVERSGTLLSPGLIGCSPLPTGPALFVNGKRVMGILCRIVLRGTIVVASEAVFIGLSSSGSWRIPVIFGEEKPVAIRVARLSSRVNSKFNNKN